MTPEFAVATLQGLIPAMKGEYTTTRKVLAAVPDAGSDYKPHPTNMSARDLVHHIVFTEIWFLESIIAGSFNEPDDSTYKDKRPSELMAEYEAKVPALIEKAAALPGEHLVKQVQFYTFDYPVLVYAQFMLSHTIHHRGQLSVYLRPMGAKVPSIYGGSADEPFQAGAAQAAVSRCDTVAFNDGSLFARATA